MFQEKLRKCRMWIAHRIMFRCRVYEASARFIDGRSTLLVMSEQEKAALRAVADRKHS